MNLEHQKVKAFLQSKLSGDDIQQLRSLVTPKLARDEMNTEPRDHLDKAPGADEEPKDILKGILGKLKIALAPEVFKDVKADLLKLVPDSGMDDEDDKDKPWAMDESLNSFNKRWPNAARIGFS